MHDDLSICKDLEQIAEFARNEFYRHGTYSTDNSELKSVQAERRFRAAELYIGALAEMRNRRQNVLG